jgi:K+-sensing histidine kinase KdpD
MNPLLARLGIGATFVFISYAVRLWLENWYAPDHFTFSTFYIAVVLSSYFLDATAAIFTGLLSAVLGYWAFATPALSWKINHDGLMGLTFFTVTSTVDIYFITAMKRAARRFQAERQRFEILAEGHAALFQDYTERTTNYLNMLSILLKKHAESPSSRDMTLIDEAWRHASTLSSLHRDHARPNGMETDFLVFARQLLENLVRTANAGNIRVSAMGTGMPIASDRAALMAMVLIECTHMALASLPTASEARIDAHFDVQDDMMHLSLRTIGYTERPDVKGVAASVTKTVDIIVKHLGGQLHVTSFDDRLSFDLMAPLTAPLKTAPPTGQASRQLFVVTPQHMTVN